HAAACRGDSRRPDAAQDLPERFGDLPCRVDDWRGQHAHAGVPEGGRSRDGRGFAEKASQSELILGTALAPSGDVPFGASQCLTARREPARVRAARAAGPTRAASPRSRRKTRSAWAWARTTRRTK